MPTAVTPPLEMLLQKVASKKKAAEHGPPTKHPSGSLPDGTQDPSRGPRYSENKTDTALNTQGAPEIDNAKKTPDESAEHEVGLSRGKCDEPLPEGKSLKTHADDKPTQSPVSTEKLGPKYGSFSAKELMAEFAKIATPVAAELVVKAAAAPAPSQTTSATTPASAASTQPTGADLAKAAKEGERQAAEWMQNFAKLSRMEAREAGELAVQYLYASQVAQKRAMDAAMAERAKRATSDPPPADGPPPSIAPSAPVPPGADAGPMAPGVGPDMGGAGPEAGMPDLKHLDEHQLQQLLMALMEMQGHADPSMLEGSADPVAQKAAKACRDFMKQGKFQVRAAKDAKDREAINQMKNLVREFAKV